MGRQSAFTNWSQYIALRSVCGVIPCFGINQNLHTAAEAGSLYYRLSATRRQRSFANISQAFPEWDQARVEHVAEQSIRHMFQLIAVDVLITPRVIRGSTWPRYIQPNGMEPLVDLLVREEPGLLLTGHFGNWELLSHYLAVNGHSMTAVARPIDNPLIDRWARKTREATGTRIVTKWGATEALQRTIEDGGRVGFIADQNAGDQGLFVPFFNKLASSYKSIGLLAMRYDVPIAVVGARRIGEGLHYEAVLTDFIRPSDWRDRDDPLFYITARYARGLEALARIAPEQYLWMHRRWRSRPPHERKGRPLPARLREKIESLPWATEEMLAAIESDAERAMA